MSTTTERVAFSITEAAELLGVGRTTLYNEVAAGRLPTVTIGRRRLITRTAVDAYLAGLEGPAPSRGGA